MGGAAEGFGDAQHRRETAEEYENGVTLDFSRSGKPTGNAVVESFNGGPRNECLNSH